MNAIKSTDCRQEIHSEAIREWRNGPVSPLLDTSYGAVALSDLEKNRFKTLNLISSSLKLAFLLVRLESVSSPYFLGRSSFV